MKVLCVINVNEAVLKDLAMEDRVPYSFDDAFRLEMRWMANTGMKLEGFVCVTDSEAENIITEYM